MWAKLLNELSFEEGRFFPVGTILWVRRAGRVLRLADGSYKQASSIMTVEDRDQRFVLVLPGVAEHDLYEECSEPPPGYKPKSQKR